MRFIIYGAGGVGGVVGGRLAQHGHDVVLIARGAHAETIARSGLRLVSPVEDVTLAIPVVTHPRDISWEPGDVVFTTMKSNDTLGALDALSGTAGPGVPVFVMQNGVENERMAARRFHNVYAVPVMLPATFLEPGVVEANSAEMSGVLDIGRYPSGVDHNCTAVAGALSNSNFSSEPDPKVMRKKYTKLLMNLGNAMDAACGAGQSSRALAAAARDEAVACYHAAGIDFASAEEDEARRAGLIRIAPIAGKRRGGGSTWQDLARGKRTVEADYLNGEIVLLGRLHGIQTPVNAALRQIANRMAAEGVPPGSMTIEELETEVSRLNW